LAEITIPLRSHDEAILVLGPYDRYAKLLRQALDVEVYNRRGNLRLIGGESEVHEAQRRVEHLLGKVRKGRELGVRQIETILLGTPVEQTSAKTSSPSAGTPAAPHAHTPSTVPHPHPRGPRAPTRFKVRPVQPRNENQRRYLELMRGNSLVFGLGSAGTGKTYLAVAEGVNMLRRGEVRRLIVTRPVVEAGENLGFLPGDLQAKVDPYMRPIFDSLYDLIDYDDIERLRESGVIEVAPLAYMRGRTLNNCFVILDEAQNTTIGQMKMFLTRMGEDARMVVTGDPSQNDLPSKERSGLLDAVTRLRGLDGIGVVEYGPDDIVRHPLVAQIVRAYQSPSRVKKEDESPA